MTWKFGRHDEQVVGIAKSEHVELILVSELNGLLVSELVSRLYPNKTNKQKEHNQPRAKLEQHDANMVCYAGCDM